MLEHSCNSPVLEKISVAMPADSRREKIFDFVREFAVKDFE